MATFWNLLHEEYVILHCVFAKKHVIDFLAELDPQQDLEGKSLGLYQVE